ncbi:MAG: amidohydrolase [Acidobacteria bacterium]|nr:amidohydrolase [Acidobacteriota bacterium]
MTRIFLALCICAFMSSPIFAINVNDEIDAAAERLLPKVIEWRRHLHQNPELGNREFKTAKYVEDHLRKLGFEVRTKIAHTGVVGILKGGQPGPVVGLRADMDALPVEERNDLAYRSKAKTEYNGQTVGVMHACGHDTHVAMLMGAAELLAGMKDKIKGTVVFIFQPAEEGPPAGEEGGASLMVKEGVMDNPKIDAIFGIHINSKTPAGVIRYKSGSMMAAADFFEVKIRGKQTHGAYPWQGADPIVATAQIINGLQTIVSRRSDLTKAPVVVTIGRINGGVRENIIPEEVVLGGTIRTLDPDMHKQVHAQFRETITKIAESQGVTAEIKIDTLTKVTYNTPELVTKMLPSLQKAAGKDNVIESEWVMGAEDFSFYRDKAPAFFFWLGGMSPDKNAADAAPHHTPDFLIDDSRLDVGVKAFANLVFDYSK